MATIRDILGDDTVRFENQFKEQGLTGKPLQDAMVKLARDTRTQRADEQAKIDAENAKPYADAFNNIFMGDGAGSQIMRGLATSGNRVIAGADYLSNKVGFDLVDDKTTGTLNEIQNLFDKKKEETSRQNVTPERLAELKKLDEQNQNATGFVDNIKAGASTLVDTVSYPSEWTVQGITENLSDPLNAMSFGAGGLASKLGRNLLTKTAFGTAGGAVEGATINSGAEYAIAKGQGKTDEEAQKIAIQSGTGGLLAGGVFGGAGGVVSHYAPIMKDKLDNIKTKSADEILDNDLLKGLDIQDNTQATTSKSASTFMSVANDVFQNQKLDIRDKVLNAVDNPELYKGLSKDEKGMADSLIEFNKYQSAIDPSYTFERDKIFGDIAENTKKKLPDFKSVYDSLPDTYTPEQMQKIDTRLNDFSVDEKYKIESIYPEKINDNTYTPNFRLVSDKLPAVLNELVDSEIIDEPTAKQIEYKNKMILLGNKDIIYSGLDGWKESVGQHIIDAINGNKISKMQRTEEISNKAVEQSQILAKQMAEQGANVSQIKDTINTKIIPTKDELDFTDILNDGMPVENRFSGSRLRNAISQSISNPIRTPDEFATVLRNAGFNDSIVKVATQSYINKNLDGFDSFITDKFTKTVQEQIKAVSKKLDDELVITEDNLQEWLKANPIIKSENPEISYRNAVDELNNLFNNGMENQKENVKRALTKQFGKDLSKHDPQIIEKWKQDNINNFMDKSYATKLEKAKAKVDRLYNQLTQEQQSKLQSEVNPNDLHNRNKVETALNESQTFDYRDSSNLNDLYDYYNTLDPKSKDAIDVRNHIGYVERNGMTAREKNKIMEDNYNNLSDFEKFKIEHKITRDDLFTKIVHHWQSNRPSTQDAHRFLKEDSQSANTLLDKIENALHHKTPESVEPLYNSISNPMNKESRHALETYTNIPIGKTGKAGIESLRKIFGDDIINKIEEKQKAENDAKILDEQNKINEEKQQAKDEQRLKDGISADWLDTLSPMASGRARIILEKQIRYKDKVYTRRDYIAKLVEEGRTFKQHTFQNNGKPKTEWGAFNSDGSASIISKVEADFGKYLSENKTKENEIKSSSKVETKEINPLEKDSSISKVDSIEPNSHKGIDLRGLTEQQKEERRVYRTQAEDIKNKIMDYDYTLKDNELVRGDTKIPVHENLLEHAQQIQKEKNERVDYQNRYTKYEALKGIDKDISYQEGVNAHRGTSFSPEKRAHQEIASYVEDMTSTYENLLKFATTPEKIDLLNSEFARFRKGYLDRKKTVLARRSNVVSSMIAGPANFPVRRMEKANNAVDNAMKDFYDYQDKAIKSIQKKLVGQDDNIIRSNDADAITKLQNKLSKLESNHEMMKKANEVMRDNKLSTEEKYSQLKELGFSDKTIKNDIAPYGKFPQFSLTNNLQNMRTVKQRISQLEKEKNIANSGGTKDILYDGARIHENYTDKRVQIFFDDIPNADIRNELKKRGFKWSPSNKAWQRLLGDNAKYHAESALNNHFKKLENSTKFDETTINKYIKDEPTPLEKMDKSLSNFEEC